MYLKKTLKDLHDATGVGPPIYVSPRVLSGFSQSSCREKCIPYIVVLYIRHDEYEPRLSSPVRSRRLYLHPYSLSVLKQAGCLLAQPALLPGIKSLWVLGGLLFTKEVRVPSSPPRTSRVSSPFLHPFPGAAYRRRSNQRATHFAAFCYWRCFLAASPPAFRRC